MALSDNLVSYWSLDEASGSAIDAHSSNDLTDNNTVGSTTGVVDGARGFESDNAEYFSLASNSELQAGDIDFTWAFWVKFGTPAGSEAEYVLSKDDGATDREYGFVWNGFTGQLYFEVFRSNTGITAVWPGGTPSADAWYFCVCWHDATANTVNLQIDYDTPTSQATGGALDSAGAAAFEVGARTASGPFYLDGTVDEIGFWKRVLTSDERTELYNSGNGRDYAYITAVAAGQPAMRRWGGVPGMGGQGIGQQGPGRGWG